MIPAGAQLNSGHVHSHLAALGELARAARAVGVEADRFEALAAAVENLQVALEDATSPHEPGPSRILDARELLAALKSQSSILTERVTPANAEGRLWALNALVEAAAEAAAAP